MFAVPGVVTSETGKMVSLEKKEWAGTSFATGVSALSFLQRKYCRYESQ